MYIIKKTALGETQTPPPKQTNHNTNPTIHTTKTIFLRMGTNKFDVLIQTNHIRARLNRCSAALLTNDLVTALDDANYLVENAPELNLKSYMLIEPKTNTVIAESNASGLIEPASMTKIMTSYVVADQIDNGLISLDDEVLISEKAWRMQGSKTFIEAGKKVKVSDLLKGIMIQSGNDASVAIAEYAGGTEDGFVDLMNAYAESLGMKNTSFKNSTGLPDSDHFSSARDLANLTSNYINKFPDEYAPVSYTHLTLPTKA